MFVFSSDVFLTVSLYMYKFVILCLEQYRAMGPDELRIHRKSVNVFGRCSTFQKIIISFESPDKDPILAFGND